MNDINIITWKYYKMLGLDDPIPSSPIACYDRRGDSVWIALRDCSICEERIDEHLTVLEDNHPRADQRKTVGILIEGVHGLFTALGLPVGGTIRATIILDKLTERYPRATLAHFIQTIRDTELMVKMS